MTSTKNDHGPEWGRHVFTKVDPSDSYPRKRKVRKIAKPRPRPESLGVGTPPLIIEQSVEEAGPSIGNVKRTVRLMALASEYPDVSAIEQRLLRKFDESPSRIAIYGIVREFESVLDLLIEKGVVSDRALREYRNRE